MSDLATATLGNMPEPVRDHLQQLRSLVIHVHQNLSDVGQLSEVLRWGQLTYLTEKPATGSMLRLGMSKCGRAAMFFHCGTTLVEGFRGQHSHEFDFEGNRALVLRDPPQDSQAALSHCIAQALMYKRNRQRDQRTSAR